MPFRALALPALQWPGIARLGLYALIVVMPIVALVFAGVPVEQKMMLMTGFTTPEGTYVNPQHQFGLRPPPGWFQTEMFPPALEVSAIVSFEVREAGWPNPFRRSSMSGVMDGSARANIMVRSWKWGASVDELIAMMKRPDHPLRYQFKSEGPTVLGNLPGHRVHYGFGPLAELEAGEHVENYVSTGERIFIVSYMTFKDVPFETYLKEANAAFESFRFLEPLVINVENGSVVVDGKRYDRLPTTLHLSKGEHHTIIAEPSKPFWPWQPASEAFEGWSDGFPGPSRTMMFTKPERITARFAIQ